MWGKIETGPEPPNADRPKARRVNNAAPGAVASGKALVARLAGSVAEDEIAASIDALVGRWESDEAGDGIAAFFDKRKPGWID